MPVLHVLPRVHPVETLVQHRILLDQPVPGLEAAAFTLDRVPKVGQYRIG